MPLFTGPASGQLALALPFLLFVGMVVLGILAVRHLTGLAHVRGCLLLCAYGVWIAFETTISVRERKEESRQDRGTLRLYALGQGVTVLSALGFFRVGAADAVAWIGACGFLLGVGLRIYAVRSLGTLYSHRVRVQQSHRIITEGPYRWVRHPAYSGMLLAHLGFVLVFFNWVAMGALIMLLLPGVVARIMIEEQALLTIQGYSEYCRQRKRLMPFIW